jgi:pyruvate, water dikinase
MIREAFQTVSEQKDAVKWMIGRLIQKADWVPKSASADRPQDPDFAEFLVECGIDSISVVPDSFIAVKLTYESRKH